MCETDGRIDIRSLAREAGWSRKHLTARFREQIGLPPKMMARVMRFNRVTAMLRVAEDVKWAEIAHRFGYYDQAHFNRDFREFAGMTPRDYFGRVIPDGGGVIG